MKKSHKQFLIGLVISAFFLWLAFRRVPLGELWAFLKTINYLWTLPLAFILIGSMYWRAVRWRLLLPPERNISSARLFGPLIIGFGLNNVFPARAGEILRPLALLKQDKVPFGEGMGTVVMERIFDSIMLLLLFLVVLKFVPFAGITRTWDAQTSMTGAEINRYLVLGAAVLGLLCLWAWRWLGNRRRDKATGQGGDSPSDAKASAPSLASSSRSKTGGARSGAEIFFLALAVIGFVSAAGVFLLHPFSAEVVYTFGQEYELSEEVLRGLTQKTAVLIAILIVGVIAILFRPVRQFFLDIMHRMTWIPAGLRNGLVRLVESFACGLDSLKSPARIFWIFIHSIGVWVSVAVAFWITSFGIPGLQLTLVEAHAFLVLTCLAIMIPAAPGYWGLYEAGGVLALLMMNVTDNESAALGFVLVVHFVQWLPITLLGLYYAAKIQVSPGEPMVPDTPAVMAIVERENAKAEKE